MTGPAEQEDRIEKIVRDVLASLAAKNSRPAKPSGRSTGTGEVQSHATSADARQPARLVLSERLISLAVLEGKLDGVAEVSVRRGAVVTPAASDTIREQGIRLTRSQCTDNAPSQVGSSLIIGVAACAVQPVAVSRLRQMLGVPIEPLGDEGLVEIVRELSRRIAAGMKGLLFTTEPAAALCLANRHRGVRAIGGRDAMEVHRSACSVAANLLIVQPEGLSAWQQIDMIRSFVDCREAACPAVYREMLG